jgi:peptidoglycan glycosyltransferase
VLALASAPSFDPNERRAEAWLAAERDSAAKPFLNRAVESVYPPGSTFKVVDLAAWLDAPGHDPNLSLNCQGQHAGYRIRDAHIHGPVGLRSAFARSCNIYFAEVGVRLGPRLMRMAERLGFNAPLPLLPEGRAGLTAVRSRAFSWQDIEGEHAFQAADFRRNPKLVAQSAIGQNLVVATPLQMARVAAIIGADGRSVAPAVFRSVGHFPDVAERGGPGVGLVTQASELVVARMMEAVMTEGTGRGLPELYQTREGVVVGRPAAADGAPRVPLAGKTGTAEVATGPHAKRPHSWFIGFAPADRPEVAVAVLVEHGGAGAEVAGPIAVRLLGEALNVIHPSPLAHGTAAAGAALAPE